jgi:hypothetical protein
VVRNVSAPAPSHLNAPSAPGLFPSGLTIAQPAPPRAYLDEPRPPSPPEAHDDDVD